MMTVGLIEGRVIYQIFWKILAPSISAASKHWGSMTVMEAIKIIEL
jgi:hypothetical protein